ncbi:hypothetical protein [Flavivirga algicola]|uniref:Uncharacterized protein n=1 Tax=Flavivirga algicola TaxID=2729136 RepID=A0ABX1RS65_9FLAO|nr:hypothetical protein [Flavivirga algicola]NMH85898.1 hypothetical protein [Flavivirga algicola]
MDHLTVSKLPLQLFGLYNNSLNIQIKEHHLIFSENGQKEVSIKYKNMEEAYNAWWDKIYKHLQRDFFDTGSDYMRTCHASMEDNICDVNYYLMNWGSWNVESEKIATSRILKGLDKGSIPHGIWGILPSLWRVDFNLKRFHRNLLKKEQI